ncbi:DUF2785 domain-containing protein [Micromonospora sp. NPDC005305]|uniref:DUF2785 domain-containing protein n=1 Tax=Micromonospora sp. NPDC005305 TaxID=3156875 RepID=UPI0033AB524D
MIDWDHVCDTDFALPATADLDELVADLAESLRDPDPEVRDGSPYVVLRTWIARDVIDRVRRRWLGDQMAARFTDQQIQARTFAPLVLDMIVSKGDFEPAWQEAFCRWYLAETDLRGYDDKLGWLHAVAHGADLLAAFGRHPRVDPTAMLELAAARLLARTEYLYAEQEDDRLARAIALTLTRAELTSDQAVRWLDPIHEDFASPRRGQTPVYRSNTMRTLRMLYILTDLGVRTGRDSAPIPLPHAAAVKDRLVPILAEVFQHS